MHTCTHRTENSTFSSKDGIFTMLGGDRPFMVSTPVDVTSRDQYTGRQGSRLGKIRGSYGKPTPKIGSRDAAGLSGRVTSISRTLYPYQQAEDPGSDVLYGHDSNGYYGQDSDEHYDQSPSGHYHGVTYDESSNASTYNQSRGYSAVSPSTQREYSSYSQRTYTETRGSYHSKKDSVQSVRDICMYYHTLQCISADIHLFPL